METARINLTLTVEADERLRELTTPRRMGDFVSKLIMEHDPHVAKWSIEELVVRIENLEEKLVTISQVLS